MVAEPRPTPSELSAEKRDGGDRRVELVHESLLTKWPRLVRWRTQDAEGAQLRDELRQAAQLWDQHGRSEDYLWTGTACREYELWRERYPGGLTPVEEAFAAALTALAGRRRIRRRIAVGLLLFAALVVASVTSALWRRSALEARRAEAAHLLSLAQLELESYPTAAVAYALAGLELEDNAAGRRLVLDALWRGPTAMILTSNGIAASAFSADGGHLVRTVQENPGQIWIDASDGSSRHLPDLFEQQLLGAVTFPGDSYFATWNGFEKVVLWSLPAGEQIAEVSFSALRERGQRFGGFGLDADSERLLLLTLDAGRILVRALRFDGALNPVGELQVEGSPDSNGNRTYQALFDIWRGGQRLAIASQEGVFVAEVGKLGLGKPEVLGMPHAPTTSLLFDPQGHFLATASDRAEVRLWPLEGTRSPLTLLDAPGTINPWLRISEDGSLLEVPRVDGDHRRSRFWTDLQSGHPRMVRELDYGPLGDYESWGGGWSPGGDRIARGGPDEVVRVWSLSAPADAEPQMLRRGDVAYQRSLAFHPGGSWLATGDSGGLAFWPLIQPFPEVIRGHSSAASSLIFGPEGRWLASGGADGSVRLWPLEGDFPEPGRILAERLADVRGLAASPDGSHLLLGTNSGPLLRTSPGGAPLPTPVGDFQGGAPGVAFSSDGRFAAGVGNDPDGRSKAVVWEVSTWREVAEIRVGDHELMFSNPAFLPDGRLLLSGASGLWLTDPATGTSERIYEGRANNVSASADGRRVAFVAESEYSWETDGRVVVLDLDDGSTTQLDSHGKRVYCVALDPTGTFVVSGDKNGVLRVGPVTGEEPHLLLGHEGWIWSVDFDPVHGRIASAGADGTIRIWPMPDLSKPPLHTLPHDELIAKLESLTNLRAARDEASPTGWKVEAGPFPGWETVPTW